MVDVNKIATFSKKTPLQIPTILIRRRNALKSELLTFNFTSLIFKTHHKHNQSRKKEFQEWLLRIAQANKQVNKLN